MHKIVLGFLLSFLMVPNVILADNAKQTIKHNGVNRSYYVHLPKKYANLDKIPLLMVLHGGGSTGLKMAKLTEFNRRADQYKYMVVYPEGMEGMWRHQSLDDGTASDDTTYLLSLVNTLSEKYKIDTRRIYVAGISNGAYMAQRVACEVPLKFAAVASVAAGAFINIESVCKQQGDALPIVYFHGTADEIVPWSSRAGGLSQGVTMDGLQFWSQYNECSGNVKKQKIAKKTITNKTQVMVSTIEDCHQNTQVKLYSIERGGHNWPGVPDLIPEFIAGLVNTDIHASDEIWKFFSQFQR